MTGHAYNRPLLELWCIRHKQGRSVQATTWRVGALLCAVGPPHRTTLLPCPRSARVPGCRAACSCSVAAARQVAGCQAVR